MASVFEKHVADIYHHYRCTLQFRNELVGGVPRDPEMIERWIRTKAGVDQADEVRAMMIQTLREQEVEVNEAMSMEELRRAAGGVADLKTNGFKRHEGSLVFEARQIKAGIKEATNILYAGDRWGRTRKGPKSFVSERVFIEPLMIPILHADGTPYTDPDAVQTRVGHVSGRGGKQAFLQQEEVVYQPQLTFTVEVVHDEIEPEQWAQIWVLMEKNGLGAARSQGYGQFRVTEWVHH